MSDVFFICRVNVGNENRDNKFIGGDAGNAGIINLCKEWVLTPFLRFLLMISGG